MRPWRHDHTAVYQSRPLGPVRRSEGRCRSPLLPSGHPALPVPSEEGSAQGRSDHVGVEATGTGCRASSGDPPRRYSVYPRLRFLHRLYWDVSRNSLPVDGFAPLITPM